MTTLSVKAQKGIGMEGPLARWYAGLTRKSLAEFQALARRVAGRIAPGSRVLEVAPARVISPLSWLGWATITSPAWTSARRSSKSRGATRSKRRSRSISGRGMPLVCRSRATRFDFLLCRAAFKNFAEPLAALREMHRVLKPGGQALIIDLRRDASRASINQAVDGMGLGMVNRILTKFIFRFLLLKRAYSKSDFESLLAQTAFRTVEIREDLIGLEIEMGK